VVKKFDRHPKFKRILSSSVQRLGLANGWPVCGPRELAGGDWMPGLTLVGPEVPLGFVDDGCSMSPDGWWRRACRVHDYEYHLIRDFVAQARGQEALVRELRGSADGRDAAHAARAELRYLESKIRHARRTADINLKENIRRCSEAGGALQRLSGWFLSRRYYGAVHRWGWKAVHSEGHAGNVKD